jgi:AraC-like DNA-binding protein
MPDFIAAEIGPKSLDRVMQRSGLPYSLLGERNNFMPETMLVSFLENSAREAGIDELGTLLAPYLTVADYGVWGEYVLGGPTLGASLKRAKRAIHLHSNDDITLEANPSGLAAIGYDFCNRDEVGYNHIAACAVGVMFSIFRHYVGVSWTPVVVELDVEKPDQLTLSEDIFGCPVWYGSKSLRIWFRSEDLRVLNPVTACRLISASDVARRRLGGSPTTFAQSISNLIRLQLLDGAANQEVIARTMGIGVRNLQRQLASEGTTFRELVNLAVTRRSSELLREKDLTVSEIAYAMGYSTPAHFARAFRKQTGRSPGEYRMRVNEFTI